MKQLSGGAVHWTNHESKSCDKVRDGGRWRHATLKPLEPDWCTTPVETGSCCSLLSWALRRDHPRHSTLDSLSFSLLGGSWEIILTANDVVPASCSSVLVSSLRELLRTKLVYTLSSIVSAVVSSYVDKARSRLFPLATSWFGGFAEDWALAGEQSRHSPPSTPYSV